MSEAASLPGSLTATLAILIARATHAVDAHLVDRNAALILLLKPPFDHLDPSSGYIAFTITNDHRAHTVEVRIPPGASASRAAEQAA